MTGSPLAFVPSECFLSRYPNGARPPARYPRRTFCFCPRIAPAREKSLCSLIECLKDALDHVVERLLARRRHLEELERDAVTGGRSPFVVCALSRFRETRAVSKNQTFSQPRFRFFASSSSSLNSGSSRKSACGVPGNWSRFTMISPFRCRGLFQLGELRLTRDLVLVLRRARDQTRNVSQASAHFPLRLRRRRGFGLVWVGVGSVLDRKVDSSASNPSLSPVTSTPLQSILATFAASLEYRSMLSACAASRLRPQEVHRSDTQPEPEVLNRTPHPRAR